MGDGPRRRASWRVHRRPAMPFLWRNVRWSAARWRAIGETRNPAWEQIRQVFPPAVPSIPPGDVIFHEGLELQRLAADLCLDAGDVESARELALDAHDHWLEWSGTVLGLVDGDLGWARLFLPNRTMTPQRGGRPKRCAERPIRTCRVFAWGRIDCWERSRSDRGKSMKQSPNRRRALELAQSCELPYDRALALTLLSEVHLAAGRSSDATAPLTEAISTLHLSRLGRPCTARRRWRPAWS